MGEGEIYKMAITAEQEKQKITFPEIRDVPEDMQQAEAAAAAPAEETEDPVAIDVDIENMEWEVESAPAEDSTADLDYDDYSDEYDDYAQSNRPGFGYRGQIRYARKINKHLFTWLFSFFLGMYGVDRILRGQVALGVIKLLTFGGFGFWYLTDVCIAAYKSYASENAEFEDLLFDERGRYIF